VRFRTRHRFRHEELADEIASYIHDELALDIGDDDSDGIHAGPSDGDYYDAEPWDGARGSS
jgi:hypothetical protein